MGRTGMAQAGPEAWLRNGEPEECGRGATGGGAVAGRSAGDR